MAGLGWGVGICGEEGVIRMVGGRAVDDIISYFHG